MRDINNSKACMWLWDRETACQLLLLGTFPVSCVCVRTWPTVWDLRDCSLPGSSVHGDSPAKNTGVDCHTLLQRIFPTQRSNPGLLNCRRILYRLSHQGSLMFPIKIAKCLDNDVSNVCAIGVLWGCLFISHITKSSWWI